MRAASPPQDPPLRRLLEQASKDGFVTRAAADSLGVPRRTLSRLVAEGVLIQPARGFYAPAVGPPGPAGLRGRAAVAVARVGGVVSHRTAAGLWGFEGLGDETDPVHLTRRLEDNRSVPTGVVLHVTRRPPESISRNGLPMTRPPRTVLDLASESSISDGQLTAFVNHCVRRQLVVLEHLSNVANSQGRGVPGVRRLRTVLADMCLVESEAEAQILSLLLSAGIEPPVTQYELRDGGRFVARLDVAWPEAKVALEVDGFLYHSDFESFVSDRDRGNSITAAGWTLLRTTPAAVRRDPQHLITNLRTVLAKRGAAA